MARLFTPEIAAFYEQFYAGGRAVVGVDMGT